MRRPALLAAAWVAAAAAAVGLGFLAVSFVGASAASSTSFLAATGSTTTTTQTATSSAPSAVTTAQQRTPGGTVVAHCAGGTAALAGAPAAGWWTDDSAGPGAVEFTNGALKVEVRATCPNGSPLFVVEGPAATGKGDGSSSPASVSSPAVVAPSPTTDDKGGLRSGGSGGSGSSGGGHGSDG